MLGKKRMGTLNVMLLLAVGMMAGLSSGCAIHLQAPIKEVAYDFSDRDFYDRAYAPSPQYEDGDAVLAPLRQSAEARARALAVADAAAAAPTLPPGAAVMMAVPAEPGSMVLTPPAEPAPDAGLAAKSPVTFELPKAQ